MSGHTPGPWLCDGVTTEGCGEGYLAYMVKAPGGMLASRANARLIAAAPELLEALESSPIPGRGEEMMSFRDRQDKWLRDTYAPAIAKARGEV